jgi:hypothetical protein
MPLIILFFTHANWYWYQVTKNISTSDIELRKFIPFCHKFQDFCFICSGMCVCVLRYEYFTPHCASWQAKTLKNVHTIGDKSYPPPLLDGIFPKLITVESLDNKRTSSSLIDEHVPSPSIIEEIGGLNLFFSLYSLWVYNEQQKVGWRDSMLNVHIVAIVFVGCSLAIAISGTSRHRIITTPNNLGCCECVVVCQLFSSAGFSFLVFTKN